MPMSDYYAILGLERNASNAEVKKAYHRLAKLYHPDKSTNEKDRLHFEEIAEAYRILGNKEKRQDYDREILISEQFMRMKENIHQHRYPGQSTKEPEKTGLSFTLGHASVCTVILSLLIGMVIALDYSMPSLVSSDTLFYKQAADNGSTGDVTAIFTASEKVEVQQDVSDRFPLGSVVVVEKTPILGNILSIELMNNDDRLMVSERVSPFIILSPFVLLVLSLGTFLLKGKPTLRVGLLSVFAAVFFITITLLFT